MKIGRVLPILAVTALVTGCAAAVNGAGPSNRNFITAEDLAEINAQTAHDAVMVLQPHWLGSRGPTSLTDMTPSGVTVFVNGVEAGDASYLRNLSVLDVAEMRYYGPGGAAVRFGMGHERGVIDVTLKGGD